MKVLVTGGAGFIGSNVVKLLVANGHEVVVLDNLSSGYRGNLDEYPTVRFIEGDIRHVDSLNLAIPGVEVVFHLAASVGNVRSIEKPIEDSEVNVIGTLRVLEAARYAGVRKVVFSSSAGIFGELKSIPIREDHPTEPDSPYGASKLAAEKLCLSYAKMYDLECVCLRYFNVYGVKQRYDAYGNVIPIFANRILQGEPLVIFGDGQQTRDFVNVRDVANANYGAATAKGLSGAFNIGSGTQLSIMRLAAMLMHLNGRTSEVVHRPPRQGDVKDSVADIAAAHRAFGYMPSVAIEDGLAEYMNWARIEADYA